MPPLARDQHSVAFDVPPEAAFWRVRRHTGGRPSTVLGPDGEPLFIPITGDRSNLRENGCNGSLRLEAVDADHKSVNAPVAFVELGAPEDQQTVRAAPASEGLGDLVKTSFDSMTRTMEAMQRAQVERERALADKERKVADAQIANRNAAHPRPVHGLISQLTGKDDASATKLRRNAAGVVQLIKTVSGGSPAESQEAPIANTPIVAPTPVESRSDEQPARVIKEVFIRPTPPKPIREVLAFLDDEANKMDDYLGTLEADELQAMARHVEALGDLNARVAWARGWIAQEGESETTDERPSTPNAPEPTVTAEVPQPHAAMPGVPPSLWPVLMQLTPAEQAAGQQLLAPLDMATIERIAAHLASKTPKEALAAIRRAIADANRRAPSVAHRSVATIFRDAESVGGGS